MMHSISRTLARIKADILAQRNIEAYVVAALAIVLAVLGVTDDWVSEKVKLAVIMTALGLLVFNLTVPPQKQLNLDDVLGNRTKFVPFDELIRDATQLWIYGPTVDTLLSRQNSDTIAARILRKEEGEFRVILQDPEQAHALEIMEEQVGDALDFSTLGMHKSLTDSIAKLELMKNWNLPAQMEYRFLKSCPGFSIVAIDPELSRGKVIIEFHGYYNSRIENRMHIEVTRSQSEDWYKYWIGQFTRMWEKARKPGKTDAPPQS